MRHLALIFVVIASATNALAQEPAPAAPTSADDSPTLREGFFVEPVILTTDGQDGSTIGLAYQLRHVWGTPAGFGDRGSEVITVDGAYSGFNLEVSGSGVIAADADRNPENFLNLSVAANWLNHSLEMGDLVVGGFVKGEADQTFENQHWVYGARGTWVNHGVFRGDHDWLAFDVRYGRVVPGEDVERQTALGATDLDDFDRVEFEAAYGLNLRAGPVRTIELNYRYFQEIDAPAAISAADLDTFQLATIRLGFGGPFFAAYSDGRLPFDRQNEQTIKVGFTYELF